MLFSFSELFKSNTLTALTLLKHNTKVSNMIDTNITVSVLRIGLVNTALEVDMKC